MFKRIWNITARDYRSSIREFIVVYIMVAPLLIAWGLTFFIPSLESTSVNFAIDASVDPAFEQMLGDYGSVEVFDDRQALENRLASVDEVIGIVQNQGQHRVVLFGDEREGAEGLAQILISNYEQGIASPVEVSFTSIGFTESPVATVGISSLILMALALGGGVIGLNIVEEKEDGTIRALTVSPMRRGEFIAGKTFTGMLLAFIQIFGMLWITGYLHIDLLQTVFVIFSSLIILVVFGFLIGVLSPNQIASLANMKFMFLPIGASIIVAVAVPAQYHMFVYWSPFYWSYLAFEGIIQQTATWGDLFVWCGWMVVISVAVMAALMPRIRKGLA